MSLQKYSSILNVYELPTVENVCNQTLREVIKLQDVSIAHVTVNQGDVSLLHEHNSMKEAYYILEGEGVLYCGKKAFKVQKGAYVLIPTNTPHKLKNIGNKYLEHLVFAIPPFNPDDVFLLDEKNYKEPIVGKLTQNKKIFEASDGAFVYELDSKEEREKLGIGFAAGFLPPNRKANLHYHKKSEEVYYVISGEGKIKLNDKISSIRKGFMIPVLINTVHGLENTSDSEKLEVLCLSSPYYTEEDFIFV